ncbi:MAG: hypothetical protein IJG34_00775 [Synergistaceae bacterium]|nr:hypothetical protein [Synergistaceae bacterium]MBQ3448421.1 hypothetical protein [Synergistaceae bacterium]MBQ3695062.1 hypothetical protein [Synergistaceae bacterium]MBQ9628536.1 hypothetical protein [Synergistaceae bacterium]MBR0250657.1 hypothetical protein [Synergistaceae bacterium]
MSNKELSDIYDAIQECYNLMWDCTHDEKGNLGGDYEKYLIILNLLDRVDALRLRLSIIKNNRESFFPDVFAKEISD